MSRKAADRVKETSTTTGTGALTLSGAVSKFRAFTSVLDDQDTAYYAIEHQSADEWEVGLGTFTTSGTLLARTTILSSSNSGAAVDFSSGTKNVYITLPSRQTPQFDVDPDSAFDAYGVQRLRHSVFNFLTNSSFEFWNAGTSVAPDGWTLAGDATVARDASRSWRLGSYSAAVTFGTGNTGELYQSIGSSTLVDYTFSCYVERTSGTGAARLVAQQASSPFTEFASVDLPTTAGQNPVALTFKPSAGTDVRFAIKSGDTVASTWVIDECMFQESLAIATTYQPKTLDDTNDGAFHAVYTFWGALFFGLDLSISDNQIKLDPSPTSDHTGNGESISATVDANATGIGALMHIASDGNYEEADADATSTSPAVALAMEAGTGTKRLLLRGYFRDDTWNWTVGGLLYLSTTAGAMTQTAPSGTGDQVQVVGYAVSADVVYFNPSLVLVEVA